MRNNRTNRIRKTIWKWALIKQIFIILLFFAISFLLWIFLGVAQVSPTPSPPLLHTSFFTDYYKISTNIVTAHVIPGDAPPGVIDCAGSNVSFCSRKIYYSNNKNSSRFHNLPSPFFLFSFLFLIKLVRNFYLCWS
jgi:hypothetical protein